MTLPTESNALSGTQASKQAIRAQQVSSMMETEQQTLGSGVLLNV